MTILDLTGTPRVSRRGFGTEVRGLTARLTKAAAQALNRTFGVHAFRKGLALGTHPRLRRAERGGAARDRRHHGRAGRRRRSRRSSASASRRASSARRRSRGPPPPSRSPAARCDLDLGGGHVGHSGGISLTAGATVVRLEDFDIRLGETPQLFASINGGSPKVAILDLDLSGPAVDVSGRTITVGNVPLKLTQGAADALNAAFGTSALSAGLVLGVASRSRPPAEPPLRPPAPQRAGGRAPFPLPLRSTNTRSIRPYSTASSGVKKRSRSRSSPTCSTARPVCSA